MNWGIVLALVAILSVGSFIYLIIETQNNNLAQCKADLAARGFTFVELNYHYGGYECWGMKSNGDPVRIW